MFPLVAVVFLMLLSYVGAQVMGLQYLFGVVIPYVALITFIVFFARRVMCWARSAVPFRIPTTCGQQKTLSWIEPNWIDNPTSKFGVLIRMILEVFLFRSLFRNTSMSFHKTDTGVRIAYRWEIWLWVAALAFHYSFLTVLVRHMRFFLEPVPYCIQIVEQLDSFFRIEFVSPVIEVGLPGIFLSGLVLLAAVTFLLLRRVFGPKVKYISLAADFFPLFLIMGIALTGILMRYFTKVDVVKVKELTMGLATFHMGIPEGGLGALFFVHMFFVCILVAYIPFSKLMHMGGVFLSPTRNLANNSRMKRHINPWNPKVKFHTYDEYEDDFREKIGEQMMKLQKASELYTMAEMKIDGVEYTVPQGRCIGKSLFNSDSVAVQRAILDKDTIFPEHTHDYSDEYLLIVRSEIINVADGSFQTFYPGECIHIMPGMSHSLKAVEMSEVIGITIPPSSGYPEM